MSGASAPRATSRRRLTDADAERLVPIHDAIGAVRQAFHAHWLGQTENVVRRRIRQDGHTLHVMFGGVAPLDTFGVKPRFTDEVGVVSASE